MTLNKISKTMVNGLEEDLGRIEDKATVAEQKIDTEIGKVTTQLAQTATKHELANVLDGSPKGVYATLADLQTAYPTGTAGVYIVQADGHIYSWSGSAWTDRGMYQSTGLADDSITPEKISFIKPMSINFFDMSMMVRGVVGGNQSVGATFLANDGYTAIIPVIPNTRYQVLHKKSQDTNARFRIALNDVYTVTNGSKLKNYMYAEESKPLPYEDNYEYYTVSIPNGINYMYVYLQTGISPILTEDILKVYEGSASSKDDVQFKGAVLASNIEQSKNIFNPDMYYTGVISGNLNLSPENIYFSKAVNYGVCAVVPVKANTSYTIRKTQSNRFRIGLANGNPLLTDRYTVNNGFTYLLDVQNDNSQVSRISTLSDTVYLIIYLTDGTLTDVPTHLQVVEGSLSNWQPNGATFKNSNLTGLYDKAVLYSRDILNMVELGIPFDKTKEYIIDQTIELNTAKLSRFDGNGALFIIQGDIVAFRLKGALTGNSSPEQAGSLFNESGFVFENTRIRSIDGVSGTAIQLQGTFQAHINKNTIGFVKQGIQLVNRNRNANMVGNHIYACAEYGIYYAPGGNIHQSSINDNMITYCKVPIYVYNHEVYNIQIVGNDLEIGDYKANGLPESVIKFVSDNVYFEDIEIVGNSIEDHWMGTGHMLHFEVTEPTKNMALTISGNVIGNSNNNEIYIKNITSASIVGNSFKKSLNHALFIEGGVNALVFSSNSCYSQGGGLLKANCNNIDGLTVSDNVLANTTQNPVIITSSTVRQLSLVNNTFRALNVSRYDGAKASVDIISESTMVQCTFKDNRVLAASSKGLKLLATEYNKVIIKDNMVSDGAIIKYEIPDSSGVISNDNL